MGSVEVFTKARMLTIENTTVVSGLVDVDGNLLLTRRDGLEINAGKVKGEQGEPAPEIPDASTTSKGYIQLATKEEVDEGLNSTKAVTPNLLLGFGGLPAGAILAWVASVVPDGWAEANGQELSRTEDSDLYAIIGTQFGVGDGVTTYNAPDLRGLSIVGQNVSDIDFDTIGKTGGAKTHILTPDEGPIHTHIQNSHTHNFDGNITNYTGGIAAGINFGGGSVSHPGYTSGIHGTTATNQNAGGGQPHNNMQPFGVFKYIIKVHGGVGSLSSTVESVLLGRVSDVEEKMLALETSPAFQARMASNQTRSGTAAWTKILFETELVDRGNCYNPSLSRFTAPKTGLYEIAFSVTPSTSTGGPGFKLYVNGNPIDSNQADVMGYGVAYHTVGATRMISLNIGDYVEVFWNNFNNVTASLQSAYGGLFSGKLI